MSEGEYLRLFLGLRDFWKSKNIQHTASHGPNLKACSIGKLMESNTGSGELRSFNSIMKNLEGRWLD